MAANTQIIQAVHNRLRKQSHFRYGILTADQYVKTVEEQIGLDRCYRYMAKHSTSYHDLLTKASQTLVYSNEDMNDALELDWTKGVNGAKRGGSLDGIELPKNTLCVFRHCLTSSRKDRDGDILHSEGASVDPHMLMIWQHIYTMPIGKFLRISNQNPNKLIVDSCIIDMNELSHDAAVMVTNKMARFSHGFRALKFSETKVKEIDDKEGRREQGSRFDIKEFEIMEESMVSIPSNPDAEVEGVLLDMVEGGKLVSPILKEVGRSLRSKRAIQVPGITYREKVGENVSLGVLWRAR